jgi:hypothetical protein
MPAGRRARLPPTSCSEPIRIGSASASGRKPTLAEFIRDQYLPYAMERKRSWKTDETMQRCHILPALGRLRLDEATQALVEQKISDLPYTYAGATQNTCPARSSANLISSPLSLLGRAKGA